MHYNEELRYYNVTLSVSELISQLQGEEIILYGEGYRNFIWPISKQGLFIDSIVRNLPSPPIYLFNGKEDNSLIIIDGIQRLNTIYMFYNNMLRIQSSKSNLNGKCFRELEKFERLRFLRGRLDITIIEDTWNSDEVIAELFYRLNISGESLNSQEIRNRLYSGSMINCIENLNNNKLWRVLYGADKSIRYRDSEYILKFFTVINNDNAKTTPISESINVFIQQNKDNICMAKEYEHIFIKSIKYIHEYIGKDALLVNNRFSSIMFDYLLIPLGILIKDGREYNIKYAYNELVKMRNRKELVGKSLKIRLEIGQKLLRGDKYEI